MKTVAATSLTGLMSHDGGLTLDGESPAAITVHIDKPLGQINPRIFGQYTEETLTSFDGGISSQLLFNRKFAMPEPRDAKNFLFKGTSEGWIRSALIRA